MKTPALFFVILIAGLLLPATSLAQGGRQLDTVGFPLDIGNKWFYKYLSMHPPSPLLTVKTIVDTSQTGIRIVRIGRSSNDSIGTENWRVINGSFYANSLLIYNASLTHDTTWEIISNGVDRYTYQLRRATLFGSTSQCQFFLQFHNSFGFSSWGEDCVALGVGWYYNHRNGDAGEIGYNYEYRLIGLMKNGILYGDSILTSVENTTDVLPIAFELSQNYPNPFNPSTTMRYGLPRASFVTLTVYNTLGQQVAQLVNEQEHAGYHDVVFKSDGLASGIYFFRLQAGDFIKSNKLILLK